MNWRSEPCTLRAFERSSSPSPVRVTAVKLKPLSIPLTLAVVTMARVTCSLAASDAELSDSAKFTAAVESTRYRLESRTTESSCYRIGLFCPHVGLGESCVECRRGTNSLRVDDRPVGTVTNIETVSTTGAGGRRSDQQIICTIRQTVATIA